MLMPLTISPRAGSAQGALKHSIAGQQPCTRGLNSRRRNTLSPHALGDPAPPDWDAEMSIFRKRTLKPSQLETIRHLEEEVDTGKVSLPAWFPAASSGSWAYLLRQSSGHQCPVCNVLMSCFWGSDDAVEQSSAELCCADWTQLPIIASCTGCRCCSPATAWPLWKD